MEAKSTCELLIRHDSLPFQLHVVWPFAPVVGITSATSFFSGRPNRRSKSYRVTRSEWKAVSPIKRHCSLDVDTVAPWILSRPISVQHVDNIKTIIFDSFFSSLSRRPITFWLLATKPSHSFCAVGSFSLFLQKISDAVQGMGSSLIEYLSVATHTVAKLSRNRVLLETLSTSTLVGITWNVDCVVVVVVFFFFFGHLSDGVVDWFVQTMEEMGRYVTMIHGEGRVSLSIDVFDMFQLDNAPVTL